MVENLTIAEMASKLDLNLDSTSVRLLAQSLTMLSAKKHLPIVAVSHKTQNPTTKKWQVYHISAYDAQLFYHFQQICMILELL